MNGAVRDGGRRGDARTGASARYEGGPGDIARGRELARGFLERLRATGGPAVSDRTAGMVQLVVSELLTNACKYAPGPSSLGLALVDGAVEITVWDSAPVVSPVPVARTADPGRIGGHGLEIVTALCQSLDVRRAPGGKRTTARLRLVDDGPDPAAGR
ncbi:ATP-binding protein [Streptomyces sp. NPDC052077]|uniref:ATP-binding protein n=1 Tax=Streptomyces sp. NPDC052077 TaxID=3154757 RepID=UPI003435D41B